LRFHLEFRSSSLEFMKPAKPDAANPAMTHQLHIVSQWRRVADLGRWVEVRFAGRE
jgi:hypothetical protein